MKTLFFTHAEPQLLPQVIFDTEEITCGPYYTNLRAKGTNRSLHAPKGIVDYASISAKLHHHEQPDLILAHVDITGECLPRNLPTGGPTKVLLIGDTHHRSCPIQRLIQYARREPFDAIILWNRQHAHFFTELGFSNVYWLPGLCFEVPKHPDLTQKKFDLCFFGQIGPQHPRRAPFIKGLFDAQIEITGGSRPRPESIELVAHSHASLNISLNGEFNLRVFESTQNKALLITDQLSHFSGLNHFYPDGEAAVTYRNLDELIEKIRYYTKHRNEALSIAERGYRVTEEHFSFAARKNTLLQLIQSGEAPAPFNLKDEPRCRIQAPSAANKNTTLRRVQIYEVAQEIHRLLESPKVLLSPGIHPMITADLADLARLEQALAIEPEAFHQAFDKFIHGLDIRNLSRIDPARFSQTKADLVILSQQEIETGSLPLSNLHPTICIWDYAPHCQSSAEILRQAGYLQDPGQTSGLFRKSAKR